MNYSLGGTAVRICVHVHGLNDVCIFVYTYNNYGGPKSLFFQTPPWGTNRLGQEWSQIKALMCLLLLGGLDSLKFLYLSSGEAISDDRNGEK